MHAEQIVSAYLAALMLFFVCTV